MKSRIEEIVGKAFVEEFGDPLDCSAEDVQPFARRVATRVLKEFVADFERKSIGLSYSAALYSTKARWGVEP